MIVKKVVGRINQILENRPSVQRKYKEQRDLMLNKGFLCSKEYDILMRTFYEEKDKGNEAESKSKNFLYRHNNFLKILGCWRWMGLYEYKKEIIDIVFNGEGIDFGGAAGPVTSDSVVVDFSEEDIFKRKVNFSSLSDIKTMVDFIFTSHTLEHIKGLDNIFEQMSKVIKASGKIIIHLPSYTCVRWRNGIHSNRRFNDHVWTFYLNKDESKVAKMSLSNTLAIDRKVQEYFHVDKAEYCGDNSIMIFAHPKSE